MLWKRTVEQVAVILATKMAPAPWKVIWSENNQRVIVDANRVPILTFADPIMAKSLSLRENAGELSVEEINLWSEQWEILDLLCLLRNNCQEWFNYMEKAGISDLGLPAKKKVNKVVPSTVLPEKPLIHKIIVEFEKKP